MKGCVVVISASSLLLSPLPLPASGLSSLLLPLVTPPPLPPLRNGARGVVAMSAIMQSVSHVHVQHSSGGFQISSCSGSVHAEVQSSSLSICANKVEVNQEYSATHRRKKEVCTNCQTQVPRAGNQQVQNCVKPGLKNKRNLKLYTPPLPGGRSRSRRGPGW